MIKKIIISLSLFLSLTALAQEGTSSPYSFYGIGDVRFRGSNETNAMGGLSVLSDSIHVNLQNPALLSSLKLTNFTIGGTYGTTRQVTTSNVEKAKRTTFDYLSVGIPVGKLGFNLSLIPYSSVGYKIRTISADASPITTDYDGIGGINKVVTGFGYAITSKFSFGADVQYNFGKIETTSTKSQNVQLGTREKNVSLGSGVTFNTGLAYNTKINKKLTLSTGFTYSPESTLRLNNERRIATVQFLNSGTFVIDENDAETSTTKIKLPSKVTFGTAIGQTRKWNIGAEVVYQNSSKLINRFGSITDVKFENATRFSVGGYYIPKYNSFTNYFSKITYRGGLRYENTGLVIKDKAIKDQALTLGLGMPLGGTFSNINVGLELGQRGTISYGLIREKYINFSIGLSFSDKWFRKSKID